MVRLANGACSLHSLAHRETFHPVVGPVAEATALYVRQTRLMERLQRARGEFVVWDVGLGAAANALTVIRASREIECSIRLLSSDCTLEPLRFALQHKESLDYLDGYESQLDELMREHRIAFGHGPQRVNWELHLSDFPALLARPDAQNLAKPHLILFDAFSAAKNPEMWTMPLFTRLFQILDPNRPCALPSFSRSTMFRVTLLLAGFFVGVGHPVGSKEETTLAANTLNLIEQLLDCRWLEKARRSGGAEPLREPAYRQAPLLPDTWSQLQRHPQFQ